MAAQKAKSSLASKLGNKGKQAFESHKNDETVFSGGGELPAGIENGIAQLVDCKFDTYKEGDNIGEFHFYAAATVITPKVVNVDGYPVPVEGLRTSIIEPLHDTPSRKRATVDDHLAWILNEMRKMGVDTSSITFETIEEAAAALKAAAPMIRFRTWKGKKDMDPNSQYFDKEPRTNHVWEGSVDYDPSVEEDVQDSSGDGVGSSSGELDGAAADNGDEAAQAAISEAAITLGIDPNDTSFPDWTTLCEAVVTAQSAGESVEEAPAESSIELGNLADGGDVSAQATLTEQATALEIDPNDYGTWLEVEQMIAVKNTENGVVEYEDVPDANPLEGLGVLADGGDADAVAALTAAATEAGHDVNDYATWSDIETLLLSTEEAEEEEAPAIPQVGEVYMYKSPKSKKEVECEVMAVNAKASTVDLKDSVSKMLYKGVTWAAILS